MTEQIPHTHDETSDSQNTHAQTRHGSTIQTPNFSLKYTKGTGTEYTLEDLRTLNCVEFDHVRIGPKLGRGVVAQFYVGDVSEGVPPRREMTAVGDYYQHDLDDVVVAALQHIEEYNTMPRGDTVVEATHFLGGENDE